MESLALYSPDARLLPRLRAALGTTRAVAQYASWSAFEQAAPRSACLVLALEWLRGEELVARLAGLSRLVPQTPLVLVTAKDADAVREVSHVAIAEIVWPHEIETGLQSAVVRVLNRTELEGLAVQVEEATWLPVRLRLAMVRALRSSRPPVGVGEAAALAGCDRRTLWRQSRRAAGGGLRLQDVFDWILLLQVSAQRSQGRKWGSIAADLGVHEHTVGRSIRRLTGLTLAGFAGLGRSGVQRLFEDRVLRPMLRRGAAGEAGGGALVAEGAGSAQDG